MSKRLLIPALLFVSLAVSCRHKELRFDSELYSEVEVSYDWSGTSGEPDPEYVDLWYFGEDTYPLFYQTGFEGGLLRLPFGGYDAFCYTNDSGTLLSRDTGGWDSFEVYTREDNILSPMGIVTRAKLNAKGAEDERVVLSPGRLWMGRRESLEVSYDSGRKVHAFGMADAFQEVLVEVRGVRNYPFLYNVSCALSGLAGGLRPGVGVLTGERVTIPFACEKFSAKEVIERRKSSAVEAKDSIFGTLYCFGHCPEEVNRHYLTLYVVLTSGEKYMFTYDVTDQMHDPSHLVDGRVIHIIVEDLPLPEPIAGDGDGISVSMDDWQAVEIDVNMGQLLGR